MTTSGRLEGRHCVVTGAAQGLGEAVARRYAAEGASVTMLDLDEVGVRRAHDAIDADPATTGEVWSTACDVAHRSAVEAAIAGGRDRFGPVDVVASVAGIAYHVPLLSMTDDDYERMMDVHVRGAFNLLRTVVAEWTGRQQGKFIAVTSPAAARGQVNGSAYSAAKAALHGLVRSAARELGPVNVQVNAILPMADTPMTAEVIADTAANEVYLSRVPLGRWGRPDEIAAAFCFLASDESDYITGTILPVDGGRTI